MSVRPFGTIVAQFQHLSHEFHRGTNLHILKGDVPTITEGGILGHKGIDIIDGREHFELRSLVRGEFPHCMKLTWKI